MSLASSTWKALSWSPCWRFHEAMAMRSPSVILVISISFNQCPQNMLHQVLCQGSELLNRINGLGHMLVFGDLSIAGDASIAGDLSIAADPSVAVDPSIVGDPSIAIDLSILGDHSIAGDPSLAGDLSIA